MNIKKTAAIIIISAAPLPSPLPGILRANFAALPSF